MSSPTNRTLRALARSELRARASPEQQQDAYRAALSTEQLPGSVPRSPELLDLMVDSFLRSSLRASAFDALRNAVREAADTLTPTPAHAPSPDAPILSTSDAPAGVGQTLHVPPMGTLSPDAPPPERARAVPAPNRLF